RNKSVLVKDAEGLKKFYDLNIKVSLWAYESEIKKIKYLTNWSEKQGVNFSDIKSKIKIKKVKEKDKGLYGVICTVSTEFTYNYLNEPEKSNMFRLGTHHYLNLKEDGDRYIITKEWYTDPFADSLDLKNIKSNEMKDYILKKEYPIGYEMNERIKKAMEYAHRYCGAASEDEFDFKYNEKYTDFNPQGGDCANFASQILHEGAGFKKNDVWNYYNGNGSKAWVNAQGFKNYMVGSGRASYIGKGSYQKVYKAAYNMRPGDFVAYEKKGRVVHISTVTGLDSKGYPLVTCHNTDRYLVPYDLGWSNDNIIFHLIHVHY
ncbi:MAG: amidase domain-containing protein, partial [Sarcina sp.]